MLHDFEEIIMFEPWLKKNREEIGIRFPRLGKMMIKNHDKLSTSGFAVAVLHEFIIISLVTYISVYLNSFNWWFGAFVVFSLHLLIHIAQSIILGRYVPCIITSILALPYCIYTFTAFLKVTEMSTFQMLLWTGIGIGLTGLSFVPAFYLATRFENWKNKKF